MPRPETPPPIQWLEDPQDHTLIHSLAGAGTWGFLRTHCGKEVRPSARTHSRPWHQGCHRCFDIREGKA